MREIHIEAGNSSEQFAGGPLRRVRPVHEAVPINPCR